MSRFRLITSRKISFLLTTDLTGSMHLRNKLCCWLTPPAKGLVVCPTIYNVDILVDPVLDKGVERSIYYFGEYEAGTVSVLRKLLCKGDVFLDAGANIGFLSCVAARFVGKNGYVYAFEPQPETFEILRKNILLNCFKNVYPIQLALGSKTTDALIYDNLQENRGSASLIPPKTNAQPGKKVHMSSIDLLLKEEKIKPPKLLKIDVEGFELDVLKGAQALLSGEDAPILCVEYSKMHPQFGGSQYDIYSFIQSLNNGYSFFKLKKTKAVPSILVRINGPQDLPVHDNIFCFPQNRYLP